MILKNYTLRLCFSIQCFFRCVDNYPNATVRYSDGSSYYIVTKFDGVPVEEYQQYIPYAYCP